MKQHHVKSFLVCILTIMLFVAPAIAAPVDPYPVTAVQPDSTELTLIPHGDEFQHWNTLKETGHTVIKNDSDGFWEYAVNDQDGSLKGSGIRVRRGGSNAPEHISRGVRPPRNTQHELMMNEMIKKIHKQRFSSSGHLQSSSGETGGLSSGDPLAGPLAGPGDWTPATVAGSKKLLVVLVNFSDRTFQTTVPSWYTASFDEAAKSVAKFYKENSFGLMTISPVSHTQAGSPPGVISVTLGGIAHPNYHNSFSFATDQSIGNAALQQITSNYFVDLDSFDTNLDGKLDPSEIAIYFVYAGFESAANTGLAPRVWAHAWWASGTGLTAGTKIVERWALNGELYNTTTQQPMGVIAHELGHQICGLPDLYDISGNNAGLGLFSLMAGGSWGGEWGATGGTTPISLDAWSREYLGWASPVTNPSGDINIPAALSSSSSAVKFVNPGVSSTEYFLVENREPVSWDRGLLRFLDSWGGILITHVDITAGTQGSNDINSYTANNVAGGGHQGVVPVQAATWYCDMLAPGNLCYGSSTNLFCEQNIANWTVLTNPNSNYYNASASNFSLFSISSTGSIMTAYASTATPFPPYAPTIGTATAGNGQATVTFIPPASDNGNLITGYTATSDPGYISASATSSPITVTGLANGTAYTFTVRATNAAGTGPASKPSNSVTPTDGICGPAHNASFSVKPATGLCSLGTPSEVAGTGPWNWTCGTVPCSATFVPDTLAPATSATPRGGDYDTAQSVSLACSDGNGSGCATTYYCLGSGCTPTTVYSGAIAVSSSQTLRFYSKDLVANTEIVKTQTYIIGAVGQSSLYQYKGMWPQLPQQWYFSGPGGVATDSSGNVYVADTYNDRIQKFDSNGVFIAAWGSYGSGNGQFSSPEGITLDSSGNVYVIDTYNYRIQKFDTSGAFVAAWGGYGSGNGQFKGPEGIAVDLSGNIYVSDTSNHRIQKFSPSGTFVLAWGSQGNGNGQFSWPGGINMDLAGNIYVADTNNNRIQKFDSNGAFLAAWGSYGAGNGQFSAPEGVTVDSAGNIYVIDTYNYRIQKFDTSGGFLAAWEGGDGSANGQYNSPGGIAVGPGGSIYVADTWNDRIQKFDFNGAFVAAWESKGSAGGQLDYPVGIAVDPAGNTYVVDNGNERIQKFDSSGALVTAWGSYGSGNGQFNSPAGIAVDTIGNVYVVDSSNKRIQKFNSSGGFLATLGSSGSGNGQFSYPDAITVDSSGNIYVADTNNHRIQKFNSSGAFVAAWGTMGSGNGQFNNPGGITVDLAGNIYVADSSNNRIQKFDSSGVFVVALGSYGSSNGQFSHPTGISVDPAGNIYVSDTYNNRIQKFDSSGAFVTSWGSYGGGNGQLFSPQGMALDSTGIVYVADSRNNRIQYFSPAYNLTAQAAGSGNGSMVSNVGGIGYAYPALNTATATLAKGTEVTLTATANAGSSVSWSGCDATGGSATNATCNIYPLAADREVTAIFTKVVPPPGNIEVQIPTIKGQLVLTWTKPSDSGFSHIHVYRSNEAGTLGTLIADNQTSIKFIDSSLASQTRYYYTVRSVDNSGNESTNIAQVSATTLDATPPGTATGITVANPNTGGNLSLTWIKPTEIDFAFITIYRSIISEQIGAAIATNLTDGGYLDTGLTNGTTYYYTLRAFDTSANYTDSAQYSAIPSAPDITPPGVVSCTGAISQPTPQTGDRLIHAWSIPADPDFAALRIYASTTATQLGEIVYEGNLTTFTHTGLNAGTTYYYTYRSMDTGGNETTNINQCSATTIDTIAPACPTGLVANRNLDNSVTLKWTRSAASDIAAYGIYSDSGSGNSKVDTVLHPLVTWTSDILTTGTTYTFSLRPEDAVFPFPNTANNCGSVSVTPTVAVCDVSASIKVPHTGKRLGGNRTTVVAEITSGSEGNTKSIRFQYSPSGENNWVDISSSYQPATFTNPDTTKPWFVYWDINPLLVTGNNYDIRAVATCNDNSVDPDPGYVTILIDHGMPESREITDGTGSHRTEPAPATAPVTVIKGDDSTANLTSLLLPAGSLATDTTVTITEPSASQSDKVPSGTGDAGSFREITFADGIHQLEEGKMADLELPYKDENNDGIVDGTSIRVHDLQICDYDSSLFTWTCLDSIVDTSKKTVRAKTGKFSLFGLLVPPRPVGSGWNLLSVPLTPVPNSATSVFGAVSIYYNYYMVINPATGTFSSATTVAPGKGYFIKGNGNSFTATGTETPDANFSIPIYKGWNMIGNPFRYKVKVESLRVICNSSNYTIADAEAAGLVDGTLFGAQNSAFQMYTVLNGGTIDPWKGYYILSDLDCTLVVPNIPAQ